MEEDTIQRVRVIDSHSAGEPTRVVIAGGPEIPNRGASSARDHLQKHDDWMRRALIHEPRGFEAIVGAFLCEPADKSCVSGVVFFNNVDYLNGCIHGTIGVIETLAHLGRIQTGTHRLETPVGVVSAKLDDDGEVTVENIPSYRHAHQVTLEVPKYGTVSGDIAWGGNWFFLISDQAIAVKRSHIGELTKFCWEVRKALENSGITGRDGGLIDHIEIFSDPEEGVDADSQNFVLCPGKAYDRSPCGTGTSAKLACLAAEGTLAEGETIRQAGILGTAFTGRYRRIDETTIIPIVQGRACITAECEMILRPDDPYRYGVESL